MKKIIIATLILSTNFSTQAFKRLCVLDEENELLSALANEVKADCSWTIQDVVEEKLFNNCAQAPKEAGVKVRDGKVIFSIYSDRYDVSVPYFYCKNTAGYKAYSSQLISLYRSEVRQNFNRRYSANKSSISHVSSNQVAEEKITSKKWRCVIPNYIPIPRVYTQVQKELLESTYGLERGFKCGIVK